MPHLLYPRKKIRQLLQVMAAGPWQLCSIWLESPVGTEPPPCAVNSWQKALGGEYVDIRDKWVQLSLKRLPPPLPG